jgi:hypothetical protein
MPRADGAAALPALHAHGMKALQYMCEHPTCTPLRTTWPLHSWAELLHHVLSIVLSGSIVHILPWQAEEFSAYEEEQQRAAAAAEAEAQRRRVRVLQLADKQNTMVAVWR